MLGKNTDEFFRQTPPDVDTDDDLDDLLNDFEEKHLTENERKLVNKS